MELLTLFRFRSNVEWIWQPKPFKSHLPGLEFLLFICIFIKIFTFENYEEPFIVKVSYCHIKLDGGEFSGSVEQLQVLEGFFVQYLHTTNFFFW